MRAHFFSDTTSTCESLDALVEAHAEAVERHGQCSIAADGEDEIHELRGVIARAQRRPGRVADAGVAVKLVGCAQQMSIGLAPAGCIRAFGNARDLRLAQA